MESNTLTCEHLLANLGQIATKSLPDATGAEPALYWNEDIARAENRQIFEKDWVCPGLVAEIPNQGDYLTFSIAGEPIFCIRNKLGCLLYTSDAADE